MSARPGQLNMNRQGAEYGQPGTYQSRAHKLATLFMMTADSANSVQFPMMLIFYGGAPFLVAYILLTLLVTMPMLHLHSTLAQFAGDGNQGIFTAVPLFLGAGYALTLYVVLRTVGASVPLSEVLMRLAGLADSLPHNCPGDWTANSRSCYQVAHGSAFGREDALEEGLPLSHGDRVVLVPPKEYRQNASGCAPQLYAPMPSYDFRRQRTWTAGQSFEHIGIQPLLSIAALWIVVFVVAHRGFLKVKNFLYVTLGLHVATTVMLLFKAVTLDGSYKGLSVIRRSDWSHISSAEMWAQALYTSLESAGVTGMVYLAVERFNFFKNNFEEDVLFVVVADAATKAIGTAMTYLFIGYLSTRTGVNVDMLINPKYNYVVSITPQTLSLAPNSEFWGLVHLIWLASSLLPKFLIIPEIVMEALSTSHPFLLEHPVNIHLLVCCSMFIFNIAVCSPGGASLVSVLAHTQEQIFRFLMIALECLVFLQLYGVRRLSMEAKMMTEREPNLVLKFCWASLIPVTIIMLQCFEVVYGVHQGRDYPWWLWAIITWFEVVEVSFIPIYAMVFLSCTNNLDLSNSLAPLPTRMPQSWEHAMLYRQLLVAESREVQEQASDLAKVDDGSPPSGIAAEMPGKGPKHNNRRRRTTSRSSMSRMGAHLVLAFDCRKLSDSSAEGRHGTSTDTGRRIASKQSLSEKDMPQSGTLHVSRKLSSIRRLLANAAVRLRQHQRSIPQFAVEKPPESTPKGGEAYNASQRAAAFSQDGLNTFSLPIFHKEVVIDLAAAALEKERSCNGDSFDKQDFVADSQEMHLKVTAPKNIQGISSPGTAELDKLTFRAPKRLLPKRRAPLQAADQSAMLPPTVRNVAAATQEVSANMPPTTLHSESPKDIALPEENAQAKVSATVPEPCMKLLVEPTQLFQDAAAAGGVFVLEERLHIPNSDIEQALDTAQSTAVSYQLQPTNLERPLAVLSHSSKAPPSAFPEKPQASTVRPSERTFAFAATPSNSAPPPFVVSGKQTDVQINLIKESSTSIQTPGTAVLCGNKSADVGFPRVEVARDDHLLHSGPASKFTKITRKTEKHVDGISTCSSATVSGGESPALRMSRTKTFDEEASAGLISPLGQELMARKPPHPKRHQSRSPRKRREQKTPTTTPTSKEHQASVGPHGNAPVIEEAISVPSDNDGPPGGSLQMKACKWPERQGLDLLRERPNQPLEAVTVAIIHDSSREFEPAGSASMSDDSWPRAPNASVLLSKTEETMTATLTTTIQQSPGPETVTSQRFGMPSAGEAPFSGVPRDMENLTEGKKSATAADLPTSAGVARSKEEVIGKTGSHRKGQKLAKKL